MIATFSRVALARVLVIRIGNLENFIRRDQAPTLIGDRKRTTMTAFDALITAVADMLCRSGGLDRGVVARALFNIMDLLRILALRLDKGKENLAVLFALRADNKLVCKAGLFDKALKELLQSRPPVLRVTFASLNMAANLVREGAKDRGIDIGDRFGMTPEELAELYVTPPRRGGTA